MKRLYCSKPHRRTQSIDVIALQTQQPVVVVLSNLERCVICSQYIMQRSNLVQCVYSQCIIIIIIIITDHHHQHHHHHSAALLFAMAALAVLPFASRTSHLHLHSPMCSRTTLCRQEDTDFPAWPKSENENTSPKKVRTRGGRSHFFYFFRCTHVK